jgi:hypothetical protein
MNTINAAVSNKLYSALDRVEGSRQIKACLDHWSLEFGYCLLFVIWSLEFLYPKSRYLDNVFDLFK